MNERFIALIELIGRLLKGKIRHSILISDIVDVYIPVSVAGTLYLGIRVI